MIPIQRKARGFTLIEALAAIAVMMIVIPIILQGFSLATSVAQQARQTTDATMIAQSHLDEMLANQIATQVYTGVSAQDVINGTTYTTSSVQTPYNDDIDVSQVDITVAWTGHGGSQQSVKLSTLLYTSEYTSQTNPTLGGGGLP